MNELNTQKMQTSLQQYQAKAIEYLNNMGMAQIEKRHQNQFLEMCTTFKLNPFSRDVYAVAYKDKFNIIVGFEVYLRRASESGKLAGWKAWTTGSKENKDLMSDSRQRHHKDGGNVRFPPFLFSIRQTLDGFSVFVLRFPHRLFGFTKNAVLL